jgi:hypothetical protein
VFDRTRIVPAVVTERRAMCDSMWSDPPDWCWSKAKPWFEVLDREYGRGMTLYMPRGHLGAWLPKLSDYSEGTEWAVYPLDREIWSTDPLYAWLLIGEYYDGFPWEVLVHIVIRSLDHDMFLVTDVRIDISEAYGPEAGFGDRVKDHPAAGVDLVGYQIDVWACGGHVRLPLPGAANKL